MGQAHAPSQSHSQPAPILMALSKAIGPLLPQQGIPFPEYTPCPAGHQRRRPYQSSAASQHGSPWCRRLVHGSIPRPLWLPQMLHSIHFTKLERRHCPLVPPYCPFPKVDTGDYLRQTAVNMLSIIQSRKGSHSPLAFGSTMKKAFIQIAQILRGATKENITSSLTPVSEPRVVQAPPIAMPITPVAELRVVPTPAPTKPVFTAPPPIKAIKKPQPVSRPANRGTRPMPGQARLPTRHSAQNAPRPARSSAQAVFRHKYAHHIAALATTPIAGKQASLTKLLRGPDSASWLRSNANKWG
jgi:hypothetical protein